MKVDPLWEEFREMVAVSCLRGRNGNLDSMRLVMYYCGKGETGTSVLDRVCLWCGSDLPKDRRRQWCVGTHCRYQAVGRYTWEVKRRRFLYAGNTNIMCRRCGESHASEVHHILPISDGGNPFDDDNLTALCNSCHVEVHQQISRNKDTKTSRKRKRAAEKAAKEAEEAIERKKVFEENLKRADEYWEQFGGIV